MSYSNTTESDGNPENVYLRESADGVSRDFWDALAKSRLLSDGPRCPFPGIHFAGVRTTVHNGNPSLAGRRENTRRVSSGRQGSSFKRSLKIANDSRARYYHGVGIMWPSLRQMTRGDPLDAAAAGQ